MHTEQEHNQSIICRSCGADYSADLPNCPYCGTMNLPAAESEYMKKLEHMRDDLEGLGNLAGQETKKGLYAMRRKVRLAAVLFILAAAVACGIHIYRDRAEARREKEEYLWQRKAFAQMDAYYADGDYDALLAFFYEAQDAGHHVWQYKHSAFCDFLMDVKAAQEALREFEAGDGDPGWLLREEISLYRLENLGNLSEDDMAILIRLRSPLLEDLDMRFQLTEEELSDFKRILAREGYISYTQCEQFLEERGMEK